MTEGGGGGGGRCCLGGDMRFLGRVCFFNVDRDHVTEAELARVINCPETPWAVSLWLDSGAEFRQRAMAGDFSDLDTLLGGRLPAELKEVIKRTFREKYVGAPNLKPLLNGPGAG